MLTMPDFTDPIYQPLVFYSPDGSNTTITIQDLDEHISETLQRVIIFSTQLGAATICAIMMMVLTRKEKVRTLLFWSNMSSLVFVIVRAATNIAYFLGPFNETYNFWTYSYGNVPTSAYANSTLATLMTLFLQTSIELSLILQVRAIYASEHKLNRILTGVATVLCLVSTGASFSGAVYDIQSLFTLRSGPAPPNLPGLLNVMAAFLAIAITFFSSIFLVKLALAIRKRRQMGLKRFGALQVIFIVGCQTLVLPTVFLIIEACVNFEGLSTYAIAIVAFQLPLSSLWASAQSTSETPTGISSGRFGSEKTVNSSHTAYTIKSNTGMNKASFNSSTSNREYDEDQELRVHVHRSFEISHPET